MSLVSLLIALVAQSAWPPPDRRRLTALYGRLCLSTAKRLNAGDRNSGMLAYLALASAVVVPVALVAWLAESIHPVVRVALDALVLYASIAFLGTAAQVGGIERSLREGDARGAAQRLSSWQGEAVGKGGGIYLGPAESATIQPGAGETLKLFHLVVPQIPK